MRPPFGSRPDNRNMQARTDSQDKKTGAEIGARAGPDTPPAQTSATLAAWKLGPGTARSELGSQIPSSERLSGTKNKPDSVNELH